MELRTRFSNKTSQLVLGGFICFEILTLCLRFSKNLGDFAGFAEAGRDISRHIDPYTHTMYTNSPVSAYLFYLLNKYLVIFRVGFPFQILNVAGIAFFLKQNFSAKNKLFLPLTLAFLLATSPMRALFGNVQVTGVVLGLVALSQWIKRSGIGNEVISAIPAWLAFEIKPQIAVPFLVYLFFSRGRRASFATAIAMAILT